MMMMMMIGSTATAPFSCRRLAMSAAAGVNNSTVLAVMTMAIIVMMAGGGVANAQLSISAITPNSPAPDASTPNTFVGSVGDQIASSLLGGGTVVLLWGAVSSDDVNAACQQIVNTGSFSVTARISGDSWGGSDVEYLMQLQVQATGGCLAAADASGTEFVFVDNDNRKSAIVCPSENAGSTGCAVYVTGDDVDTIYNSAAGGSRKRRRLLGLLPRGTRRHLLADDCQSGAKEGAITGAVTGILGTAECLALGPLAPFCIIGVLGVSAELGALGGCVASCFPGDATVTTRPGITKQMSELEVGDEVAVWKERDGTIAYQDIYAFGHKEANTTTFFIHLSVEPLVVGSSTNTMHTTTQSSRILRLTSMHFVPTATSDNVNDVLYKRAQDVQLGDILWATRNDQTTRVAPFVVKDISTARARGLYNPLTLSGTILVDGVVASVHSEWFLDSVFDSIGLTHLLPHAYQILLAPARFLYSLLSKDAYIASYNWIDARLDIPKFGTKFGSHVTLATLSTTTILASIFVKFYSRAGLNHV